MNSELFISIAAIVISVFALGWNFYKDIILKPRLRVKITTKMLVQSQGPPIGPFIGISGTNFGPGTIICNNIIIAQTSFWRKVFRKQKYATIIHDYKNPHSSQLPIKLDVGECVRLLLKKDKDNFLKFDPTHVGIADSFGRIHWAEPKSLKKEKIAFFNDFNKADWNE